MIPAMAELVHPSAGVSEVPALRKRRVLVVDDDRDTRLTLALLLDEEGYDVEVAATVEQFWRSVDTFDPDVVLLDIGLTDHRNGYDLARGINNRYRDFRPILIAVTAWSKPSDLMLAEMAGFDHHIAKPYEPAKLLELIRRSDNARSS
jgi:DNA-binding response OmpR family regulator